MEKFSTLTAVAAPIDIDNLDTDQLMPKQFLHGIDKSGLARGLLWNYRMNADGTRRNDCVLNRPGFKQTKIIVSGPNFGCGSSREHAVWGLMQYGIRAVVAPSFGEIFYSNCFNNGLLAARVTPEDGAEILSVLSETEPVELTIDLPAQTIEAASADKHGTSTSLRATSRCFSTGSTWWMRRLPTRRRLMRSERRMRKRSPGWRGCRGSGSVCGMRGQARKTRSVRRRDWASGGWRLRPLRVLKADASALELS